MKTEEELIWEAYTNDDLYKLLKIIKMKYKNRRVVATTNDSLDLNKKYNLLTHFKPVGLWYALGGEWLQFLTAEWGGHGFKYKNIFYIDIDYSQILRINTNEKFEKFEKRYSASENYDEIDWVSVSQKYKGIEIIPFLYDKRKFSSPWYLSWDIASGCIWDNSAIKGYKNIKMEY